MSDELGSVVRVAGEEGVSRFECVLWPPRFDNPLKVLDDIGNTLGTAVASHTLSGGIHLEFFLNKNTPEAFLAEVERKRVQVRLNLTLTEEVYRGVVFLVGR